MRSALQIAGGLALAALAGRAAASLDVGAPRSARAADPVASRADPVASRADPVASRADPVAPPADLIAPPTAPVAASDERAAPQASMATRAERVASYTLRARLDPAEHALHGEGAIVWKNASRAPQRELFVHLYLNAFKGERTVFLRTPIGGFRGNEALADFGHIEVKRFAVREMDGADVWPPGRPTTPGDPDDETDIRVELPRPVAPGESITIDLAWDAHLPAIAIRTGHYGGFHMVGQWFPKIARLEPDGRWAHFPFHRFSEFYADFGAYDVTVDVPDGFLVGATGKLMEETIEGGRAVRRFVQDDVHDFAFAAWDRFREMRATTGDGVAIRCLYPPGEERAAATEIDAVRFGLGHFGAAFGRYPYGTLTIVHPPEGADEAGGMEYPTLITTGGSWLLAATGARLIEGVTLHELAHQWFYGLVATNEHRYPFLDEGLTTYAEVDALRALFGDGSGARALGVSIDMRAVYRAGAIATGHNGVIAQAAPDFIQGADYGGLVYARTTTLLATLGGAYGDDAIRRAVGRYARDNRFRHPDPSALLDAMREVAGAEAAEALRIGVFEGGWVDYAVADLQSRAADDAPSDGGAGAGRAAYTGHAFVRRRGTLALPVDIDLHGRDGTVQRVRWAARDAAARIPYEGASPLVAAVIDPEHRLLLDEDLTNNAYRERRPALAPRVLDLASFAAGAALSVLAP